MLLASFFPRATLHGFRELSSLLRDGTRAPTVKDPSPKPLNRQGIPLRGGFFTLNAWRKPVYADIILSLHDLDTPAHKHGEYD